MFLTNRASVWSLVCVTVRRQGWRTLDWRVNKRMPHPDAPTKAAICAAVLPTELTTSVSAPASNIIHVMSVLPADRGEEESGCTYEMTVFHISPAGLTAWQHQVSHTRETGEHQRRVSVFMLVAVHVGAVLQQQLAHVRLSFVGCMHEGGHPILMRHTTTKKMFYAIALTCITNSFRYMIHFKQLPLTGGQTMTTSWRRTWRTFSRALRCRDSQSPLVQHICYPDKGRTLFEGMISTSQSQWVNSESRSAGKYVDKLIQLTKKVTVRYRQGLISVRNASLPHPNSWPGHPYNPGALRPLEHFLNKNNNIKNIDFIITAV